MPVYLPTAAIGNSRVLVTLGAAGELMGFGYPHIDFAQNVREGLTAVHATPPGGRAPECTWLFEDHWQRRQAYVASTNILRTVLTSELYGLTVEITDVVPPETTLLARQFRLLSHIGGERGVSVLHYFRLALGEVRWKQSVRHVPEQGAIVQRFRDIVFAVGGDAFSTVRCGKAVADPRSAKLDIGDGVLGGQPEDIGEVDFAVAWAVEGSGQWSAVGAQQGTTTGGDSQQRTWRSARPATAHGSASSPRHTSGVAERVLLISAGESEGGALEQLAAATQAGFEQLLRAAQEADRGFVESAGLGTQARRAGAEARQSAGDEGIAEAYERAVLSLPLLQDAQTGAIIAAPEFDPTYERCGGYGYVWPRDGAYAALALARVGHRDAAERFLDWCAAAQGEDGLWRQRYWADASLGPTWCAREQDEQLDQSATVLFLAGRLLTEVHRARGTAFLDRYGTMIDRGAEALLAATHPERMHRSACDLWESFHGSFTYTGAAIWGALETLRTTVGRRLGRSAQRDVREAQRAIKETITGPLWLGTHLARGIAADGSIDKHVDSSILGAFEPFGVLSLDDDTERAMVEHSVAAIEEHLAAPLDAGNGIFRFQFDTYLGGAIGCVNTLWLAKVLLQLAAWYRERGDKRAAGYLERARSYVSFCLKHRTPTGLFPELIGRTPDTPYWAAPHAWASAVFVEWARLLREVLSR